MPVSMRSICLHFSGYVYIYERLHEVLLYIVQAFYLYRRIFNPPIEYG